MYRLDCTENDPGLSATKSDNYGLEMKNKMNNNDNNPSWSSNYREKRVFFARWRNERHKIQKGKWN